MPAAAQDAAVGAAPFSATNRRTASKAKSLLALSLDLSPRGWPPNTTVFELCMAGSTKSDSPETGDLYVILDICAVIPAAALVLLVAPAVFDSWSRGGQGCCCRAPPDWPSSDFKWPALPPRIPQTRQRRPAVDSWRSLGDGGR